MFWFDISNFYIFHTHLVFRIFQLLNVEVLVNVGERWLKVNATSAGHQSEVDITHCAGIILIPGKWMDPDLQLGFNSKNISEYFYSISEYSIAYSNDGTFSTKFQDQGKILNRDDRYSKFYMYSCHHLC